MKAMSSERQQEAAKMHKLRRAVDRLRHVRATGTPPVRRQSWLERLKARLGLGGEST